MSYISNIRTDLALEINENVNKDDSAYRGIVVTEDVDKATDIKVTTLEIVNKHGEKILGREKGRYITIEAKELSYAEEDYSKKLTDIVADKIIGLTKPHIEKGGNVLVVGLGNREVTADSLGPLVVDGLNINRHLDSESKVLITSLCPGVMAQTGIETAQIIKGVVTESKPKVIIVIDALAARDSRRLNSTIQISDRGINPGSGVGNHRVGITEKYVGVPVVAIGVPTVIDAPTIVYDALDTFIKAMGSVEGLDDMARIMECYNDEEKYELAQEVISPIMADMYVTPKDIDSDVRIIGGIIANAINCLCA
ncbi:MAG: GPR endopeptidase [Lachnospira sp.]|nr:GPR endopeptidase [Lachnospira sp.]